MPDLPAWMLILIGLVLLVVGGEMLVRGSVRVAERLGVSPLLIGLTLVGFGTSAPELVTSVQAALIGSPEIAVGNFVGSNIFNVLLILGLSVLILPVPVPGSAIRRDAVVVVGTAALLWAAALTVGLTRPVGAVFVALLAAYILYAYRQERQLAPGSADHTAAFDKAEAFEGLDPGLRPRAPETVQREAALALIAPIAMAVAGLAVVIFGARWLVDGAVGLAREWGMSEAVIGLTIVAAGTSMPELVTSVVASIRKQADVALGNILGSNIYNILGIGGVTALISPTDVPASMVRVDIPVMIAVSLLLLLFCATGRRLSRVEGAVFVGGYLAYTAWLLAGV